MRFKSCVSVKQDSEKTEIKLSPKAEKTYKQTSSKNTKLGDLRNIAENIKKDHELAMELWSTDEILSR